MNPLEKKGVSDVQVVDPMTELQKIVETKLTETVKSIMKEVLTKIIEFKASEPNVFVETQITPRQIPLSGIDERTGQFFRKVMGAVNEEVNKIPTLGISLQILGLFTQDLGAGKKYVEGIAFPHVNHLISYFDGIKPSIVDDIIAS